MISNVTCFCLHLKQSSSFHAVSQSFSSFCRFDCSTLSESVRVVFRFLSDVTSSVAAINCFCVSAARVRVNTLSVVHAHAKPGDNKMIWNKMTRVHQGDNSVDRGWHALTNLQDKARVHSSVFSIKQAYTTAPLQNRLLYNNMYSKYHVQFM